MNQMEIFKNPEFGTIRAVEIDGEPWLVGKEKGLATHRQALLFYPCYPNFYFAFGVKMTSITSAPLNSFCANF